MRFHSLLLSGLVLAVFSLVGASSSEDERGPEILVTASFPEENPFGQIINGQRNRINLLVENQSEQNVTLLNIGGAFHDPNTNRLIQNTTSLNYGIALIQGVKLQLAYAFHTEFKPGDITLNVWINYVTSEDKLYHLTAFDQVVTVVEPEVSIFNYQVFSTYLLTTAFVGGLVYFAYITFFPQTKKRTARAPGVNKPSISAPVGKVTATGVGGYEEEWIPEHHLKKTKASKKKVADGDETGATSMSSGDELVETKKRKSRK